MPRRYTVAADAGEHPVADEIGVQAVDRPCADAGELEKQSIDLRLGAGLGGIGIQIGSAGGYQRSRFAAPHVQRSELKASVKNAC